MDVDLRDLPMDPGLCPRILDYDPNIQDQIQKVYLKRGPCQPKGHEFPFRDFGGFVVSWFDEFDQWLEYSIAKDAKFCLCCYLFRLDVDGKGGGDHFVGQGHSSKAQIEFRTRLNATADCVRYLLRQGLPFRGHDESYDSNNQGNFLELLRFLVDYNKDVYVVAFKNAPDNLKLTSPKIQKYIVALVALAKNQDDVNDLLNIVAIIVNIAGDSSQCCTILRNKQASKVIEALSNGELSSGKSLNQEINLKHANDTCWSSHYGTLTSIILLFSSIIDVLEIGIKDGINSKQRFRARNI
ncbi:uncharacterized protein LOC116139709 [Pistacia vera]|uniref:uncharacterized protein LOC116139709 n=1 Tax=Pistacia vera TaxID=55513 RepID=UPI001262D7B7|nr:uncharacterized protein LOC116139709 [Pistacia vera]